MPTPYSYDLRAKILRRPQKPSLGRLVMLIVSNTSPLSNLGMSGQLPLLQQIYPKVIILPMVHSELMCLSVIQTVLHNASLQVPS